MSVQGTAADLVADDSGATGSLYDTLRWELFGIDPGSGFWELLASGEAPIAGGSFTIPDLPVVAGQNTVVVRAFDSAGNASHGSELSFFTDPAGAPGAIAPTITSTAPTAASEDTHLEYQVTVSDPDPGDVMSFLLEEAPESAWLDSQTGLLTWYPENADVGTHGFRIRVLDLAGLSDMQAFSVTVANVNDPPLGSDGAYFDLSEDVPFRSELFEEDEDQENPAIGELLSFTLLEGPPGLVLDAVGREIRWTPTQADVGPVTVRWRVQDLAGAFSDSTWTLEVAERNDAPHISSIPRTSAREDEPYDYQIAASDEEPGALTTTLVSGPPGMVLDPGGALRFTPADADVGSYVVEIRVTDAGGASIVQRYTLTVANVPDPPVFASAPVTDAAEDTPYLYDAEVTDADPGDTHTFSLRRAPAGMTVAAATGVVSWLPGQEQVGSHLVELKVQDASRASALQAFTVTVAATNDAPSITSSPPTDAGDRELYRYEIVASDPDPADSFNYEVSGPAGMSVDSAGAVTWTPGGSDIGGSFPVTVTVRDGAGAPAVQSFVVTVADVNNAPFFVSDPVTMVAVGDAYAYDAEADDHDAGDSLSFALASGPEGMTVDPGTGAVAWTPSLPEQAGENEVTLTATDAAGAAGTQSFSVYAQARPVASFAPAKAMRVTAAYDGAHIVARENMAGQANDDLLAGLNVTRSSALPASLTIDLAGERAHALAALSLRGSSWLPEAGLRDFELWVSETGHEPDDFTLALTGTLPADGALHAFPIEPARSAHFAKLVLLSSHDGSPAARLAELRLDTRDHDGGVVSYGPGGASVVAASPTAAGWDAARILDRGPSTNWRTQDGVTAGAFVVVQLGAGPRPSSTGRGSPRAAPVARRRARSRSGPPRPARRPRTSRGARRPPCRATTLDTGSRSTPCPRATRSSSCSRTTARRGSASASSTSSARWAPRPSPSTTSRWTPAGGSWPGRGTSATARPPASSTPCTSTPPPASTTSRSRSPMSTASTRW